MWVFVISSTHALCISGSSNWRHQATRLRVSGIVTRFCWIHICGDISDWNTLRLRSISLWTVIPETKFNKEVLAHRLMGTDQSLQICQRLADYRRGIQLLITFLHAQRESQFIDQFIHDFRCALPSVWRTMEETQRVVLNGTVARTLSCEHSKLPRSLIITFSHLT